MLLHLHLLTPLVMSHDHKFNQFEMANFFEPKTFFLGIDQKCQAVTKALHAKLARMYYPVLARPINLQAYAMPSVPVPPNYVTNGCGFPMQTTSCTWPSVVPIGEDPAAHGHWCAFTDLYHAIPYHARSPTAQFLRCKKGFMMVSRDLVCSP